MLTMKTIQARAETIRSLESDIASDEAKLSAYEDELKMLAEELKQKHGYDAVSKALEENRSELAAQKSANMRDAAFLAIDAICGLLDADPERVPEFLDWLKGRWRIIEEHNDQAGGRGYAEHFKAYAAGVCRNEWWAGGRYEILDGGACRIEQDQNYKNDPCIALTLPADILSDPALFLASCRSFTATAAKEWAARYVEANAGRTEKLDALRRALKTQ